MLQFAGADVLDYDRMIALEDALLAALPSSAIVDGHDFGSGEINIFIHTNAPTPTFKKCLPSVNASGLTLRGAAYRPLGGDTYSRLWPPGDPAPFHVV